MATEESETSVVNDAIGLLRFVSDQPSQVMTLSMMATPKKISHRVISAFSLASRPFSSSMLPSLVDTCYSGCRIYGMIIPVSGRITPLGGPIRNYAANALGQVSLSGQFRQSGLRAWHMARPCSISL